ncbi:MAG: DoxX family protein [Saprospiraceae bacterium]|nr:DoxX family protein [Saprospiraceae bacterium]
MKDVADLLGRIFISLLFIFESLDTVFFFDNTKKTLTDYGITYHPNILLGFMILLVFIGSILVLIGYYARVGAFMLLVYWLTFTLTVYSFWNDPPSLQRINSLYFMRNMALCGGLLLLIANGAGNYSVKRLIHVMRLPK